MITFEIPASNSCSAEQDAFVKFILKEISENGVCNFAHYGAGWGTSCVESYEKLMPCGSGFTTPLLPNKVPISRSAYNEVIDAFVKKGYSVIYGEINCLYQHMTIK